jgi:hypothetical protein
MSNEGAAKVNAEALRNRNLAGISRSQQLLNIMNQYSGGGGGGRRSTAAKPTPLPGLPTTAPSKQPTTVQRALKDNFLYNTPGTPEYVGKTKPASAKQTARQIMDKRLGMV